jgi:hypothetical protein
LRSETLCGAGVAVLAAPVDVRAALGDLGTQVRPFITQGPAEICRLHRVGGLGRGLIVNKRPRRNGIPGGAVRASWFSMCRFGEGEIDTQCSLDRSGVGDTSWCHA